MSDNPTPRAMGEAIEAQLVDRVALRVVEMLPKRKKFDFAPLRFALARLGEPSTWLAIFAALALLGFTLPVEQAANIAKGAAALAAIVAALMPENQ